MDRQKTDILASFNSLFYPLATLLYVLLLHFGSFRSIFFKLLQCFNVFRIYVKGAVLPVSF